MSLKKARAGPLGTTRPSKADELRIETIGPAKACIASLKHSTHQHK